MVVRKHSVGGSRFTSVSAEGVREALSKLSQAQIQKYLGQLGEPESPAEALAPKVERLTQAWLDGRLRDLAKDLGLEPTEQDRRRAYGA